MPAHLDLLIVNDHEIGGIAGIETVKDGQTDVDACKAAAAAVLALGVSADASWCISRAAAIVVEP